MKKSPSSTVWSMALALVYILVSLDGRAAIPIVLSEDAAEMEQLAARDLSDILQQLHTDESFPLATRVPRQGKCILLGNMASCPQVVRRVRASDLRGPNPLPPDP